MVGRRERLKRLEDRIEGGQGAFEKSLDYLLVVRKGWSLRYRVVAEHLHRLSEEVLSSKERLRICHQHITRAPAAGKVLLAWRLMDVVLKAIVWHEYQYPRE